MNHYDELIKIRNAIIACKAGGQEVESINKLLTYMEESPPVFVMDYNESKCLWDYFLNRAGYISAEFDLPVHKITDRLRLWVEKRG